MRDGAPVVDLARPYTAAMRSLAVVLVAVAALSAACGGDSEPGPTASPAPAVQGEEAPNLSEREPTAQVGKPFRNGDFEATITKVTLGVKQIDLDETAKSGGLEPFTPDNGQFIVVYLSAKNVGMRPASFSTTDSTLVDSAGREYSAGGPYLGGVVGQGLDEQLQPGAVRAGWIAFDVPAAVTSVSLLAVQSDAYIATTNAVTVVKLA